MSRNALSRLICAAIVNEKFRNLLLRDPALAIAQGYLGDYFKGMTEREQNAVYNATPAQTLEDFAAKLLESL